MALLSRCYSLWALLTYFDTAVVKWQSTCFHDGSVLEWLRSIQDLRSMRSICAVVSTRSNGVDLTAAFHILATNLTHFPFVLPIRTRAQPA